MADRPWCSLPQRCLQVPAQNCVYVLPAHWLELGAGGSRTCQVMSCLICSRQAFGPPLFKALDDRVGLAIVSMWVPMAWRTARSRHGKGLEKKLGEL